MALSKEKLIKIKDSLIKAHHKTLEHEDDENYKNEFINLAIDVLAELDDSLTPSNFAYTAVYKEAMDEILISRRKKTDWTTSEIHNTLLNLALELGIKSANHLIKELEVSPTELQLKGASELTYPLLKKIIKYEYDN